MCVEGDPPNNLINGLQPHGKHKGLIQIKDPAAESNTHSVSDSLTNVGEHGVSSRVGKGLSYIKMSISRRPSTRGNLDSEGCIH